MISQWEWAVIAASATLVAVVVRVVAARKPIRKLKPPVAGPDDTSLYEEGDAPFWLSDATKDAQIHLSKSGIASSKPVTVIQLFNTAVKRFPDAPALKVESSNGVWKVWTWMEYWQEIQQAARAFIHLGLPRHGTVNIMGFNRPEWLISNNASILAGGKSAGIYTTNSADSCLFITNHCKASVIVVENGVQLAKFVSIADKMPHCKAIILYTKNVTSELLTQAKEKFDVYFWNEFMALGEQNQHAEELQQRMDAQTPGSTIALIYTSGTTGTPKAVMVSHDSVTWMAQLVGHILGFGDSDEFLISYLPLSHIAAQIVDIFLPLCTTANMSRPCTLAFARPDALAGSLGETLREIRPTLFFGVPRVWEKFAEKIQASGRQTTGLKKMISTWAKRLGLEGFRAGQDGGSGLLPPFYFLADKLVFSKVKQILGLDRCRWCYTGAAPISVETLEYLGSLGLVIVELYGMSECSGAATVCTPLIRQAGSVGFRLPGVEVVLDHVEGRDKPGEGEILVRGRLVMTGYMDDPKKTAGTIDEKGFLHSGDIGRFNNGFLSICGRIKELIITAGGENVAPVPIEHALLNECPALSNAIMIGDHRKYNIVLVTLKCHLKDGLPTSKLAGEALRVSSASSTVEDAIEDPAWQKYLENGLRAVNALAVSRAQRLQYFRILPIDLSVAGGELTSSLKLCRPKVVTKYHDLIESVYN